MQTLFRVTQIKEVTNVSDPTYWEVTLFNMKEKVTLEFTWDPRIKKEFVLNGYYVFTPAPLKDNKASA